MKLLIKTNLHFKVSAQLIKFLKSKNVRALSYKDYDSVYLKLKGLKFEIKS